MVRVTWEEHFGYGKPSAKHRGVVVGWLATPSTVAVVMSEDRFMTVHINDLNFEGWTD